MSTSIGLSMIVKNEAHVIERCLRSVRPLLSTWVIVDTGSTDDTEAVARRALEGIPGEYVSRPWVDFATNRNEALELSRSKADYSLVIDADDELELAPGFVLPELHLDVYLLAVIGLDKDQTFFRPHLLSNAYPHRYDGAVHETVVHQPSVTSDVLPGLVYRVHLNEGGRSRVPGNKYQRDAEILEGALGRDPENAKNVYFLGQSYAGAGDTKRAIEAYERYVKMAGSTAMHRFLALVRVGEMREAAGAPMMEVLGTYLRAHAQYPRRADAMHRLACYARSLGETGLAHAFSSAALALPRPEGEEAFLASAPMYAFEILEEHSLASFSIGLVADQRRDDQRIIAEGGAPGCTTANARARLRSPAPDPSAEPCAAFGERLVTSLSCEALPIGSGANP
jgi:glycosyltransferase involved in cell wall biosynthesis